MSDYLFLMESRVTRDQWRVVTELRQAAEKLGMTLYLVGGAIRDLICGFPIEGLDFVAEGKALHLLRSLNKNEYRITSLNESLQEAELEFSSGAVASIAMARSETFSSSGARQIEPATIMLDLKRRDFSINSIGVSLNAQSHGLLLDPTNGAGDIERKEIRGLHNRTFIDDPVRMFRAVRFRTRLGFALEQKTAAQFESAKENDLQERASGEGLAHELRQIARERNPVEILKALEKEKLLIALHPHLQGPRLNLHGIAQATKIAQTLPQYGLKPPSFDLFLYLLLVKLPPRDSADLLKRLELKKPESQGWQKLETEGKHAAKEVAGSAGGSPTKLYHLLSGVSSDVLVLLQTEFANAKVQSRVKAYLQKYLPLRYQLPRQELESLGIPPNSPRFQEILEAYFFAAIEGKLRQSNPLKFLKSMVEKPEKKEAGKAKPAAVRQPAQAKSGTKPASKVAAKRISKPPAKVIGKSAKRRK